MNKKEIDISIIIPTREREKYLRRALLSLDIYSNFPEKIEYLVWIDDDDIKSINMIKKIKEQIPNVRFFVCPRFGYFNIWFMVKHLIKQSKGKIILPFGDDCFMKELYWDEKMIKYAEEKVFIGWRTRWGFSKKILDEIDIVQLWEEHTNKICEFIRDNHNNILKPMRAEWFGVEDVRPKIRFKSKAEEREMVPCHFDLLKYEQ